MGGFYVAERADDYATAIVTRAEWQAAVDALKGNKSEASDFASAYVEANKDRYVKAWNGVDTPPVGNLCEIKRIPNGGWGKAIVRFSSRNVIVWDWSDEPDINGNCTAYLHEVEFRPIRTPEQIAAEERLAAINYMEIDAGMCATAFDGDPEARVWVTNLIDKGWRKPIPATPEEREKGIESLRQLLSKVACDDFHAAVAVYDAGYRKQEPK